MAPATMPAALRLLLRRRAEAPSAPSLALLQPLFRRPYSKLSAPLVPSVLRLTSGEGCSALPPRKPTDRGRQATQRPTQPSCTLLAITATSSLLGMQRMHIQSSPPQVPSVIRHYSSKPQLPQQPIVPWTLQHVKQAQSLLGAVNSLVEQLPLVLKGIETCEKACDLLDAGVDDDKVFAMFENGLDDALNALTMFEKGLDDALNALAVYEKDLDVLAKALGSTKGMRLDIDLELERMTCKRIKNKLESLRQKLKKLQRSRETQRTMEKICKWLEFAYDVLGGFVLLMLLLITIGIYLA